MASTPPGSADNLSTDELTSTPVPSGSMAMDPRLMRARALFASAPRRRSSSSTGGDELAVIAKVSDLQAWNALSEVRPGVAMGPPQADGSVITTARIPIVRLDAVRQQPFVISMKAAQRVNRVLEATVRETLSRPADLPKKSGVAGGSGVVVGVVDFGGDFVHQNFRKASGKTRLLALWDQNQPASAGAGAPAYGKLLRAAQLDAALKTASPYASAGYFVEDAAHGTHVMDIAGGNGRGSGVAGMAPQADLVFVELAASDVPWSGREVVGAHFGDSVQLLEALHFIFNEAGSRPCVVNLSLGTNGGPHDGSNLVEQGIDRLVRAAPNRAVVIAASNSQSDGIHAQGTVPAAGRLDLKVTTLAGPQRSEDECELWYAGAQRLAVELLAPNGTRIAQAAAGSSVQIQNNAGQVVGLLSNRLNDPNNGDNVINFWWSGAMPKGTWTLRLRSAAGAVDFHAWLERNDTAQARFASHEVASHTLGSISCGRESIVVASYDAHKATAPISWFSSSGPTRDGRQKPEVSAPGHDVVAARSSSVNGTTSMSGTSMAAPAASGLVALVLARAKARKLKLSVEQIRNIVINSGRQGPPTGAAWDARYGHGRICGRDAVAQLMGSLLPVSAAGAPAAKKTAAKKAAAKKTAAKKTTTQKTTTPKAPAPAGSSRKTSAKRPAVVAKTAKAAKASKAAAPKTKAPRR